MLEVNKKGIDCGLNADSQCLFTDMKKINKKYESPTLEVLTVSVEQGYQASGNDDGGISAPSWGIL